MSSMGDVDGKMNDESGSHEGCGGRAALSPRTECSIMHKFTHM